MNTHDESVMAHLQEVARNRQTTCYQPIADLVGLNLESALDRKRIGDVVGKLSEREHEHGRPMISAVVVRAEDSKPGSGFFKLARQLGLWTVGDEDTFYVQELKRVHDYWAD